MSWAVYKLQVKLARYISEPPNSAIAEPLTELKNVFLAVQPYLEHAELLRAKTKGNQQLLKWISNVCKLSNETENLVDIYCLFQSFSSKSTFFTSPVIEFFSYAYSKFTSFHNHLSVSVLRKQVISFSKTVVEFHGPEIIRTAKELHLAPNSIICNPCSTNSGRSRIGVGKFDRLIGRDEDVKAIKDLITTRKNVEIVAVEGVEGIGKTAIAKAVFNDVKGEFDCYAWVVFSHPNTTVVSFLKDVIRGLFDSLSLIGPRNLDEIVLVTPLKETIRRCLAQKKFLLVIDDISSHQEILPDSLQDIFPPDSSGKILITTHGIDILKEYIHTDNVYKIERLKPQDAVELLCRSCNMEVEDKLWLRVESIAKEITEMCQYVPLSIKVIGGLLSTKTEVYEWNSIQRRLSKSDLLPLCYAGMQPALRTCFLYSLLFADQVEFSSKMLQRMWIAEDLIEPEPNLSLEETAKLVMADLIQRNFFQVVCVGIDGETKTCSILRPIRDFGTERCVDARLNPIVERKSIAHSAFDNFSLFTKCSIYAFILYGCFKIDSKLLKKLLILSSNEIEWLVSNLTEVNSVGVRRTLNGVSEFMERAKEFIAVKCFTSQKNQTTMLR